MLRDGGQISIELGFTVDDLGKVAARSRQRLYERGRVQLAEMGKGILTLVAFRTKRAMPLAQEKIFAAERGDAGVFQNSVGEIFVGCERRRGGIVLRIP